MKRLLAILLLAVMVCCLLSAAVFADGAVTSPEHGNTDEDVQPTSPQTGYAFGISFIIVAAVLFAGIAFVSIKKVVG